MKHILALTIVVASAACGTETQTVASTTSNPNNTPSQAAAKEWPTSGQIDCSLDVPGHFTGTYSVATSTAKRDVSVTFADAGQSYGATYSWVLADVAASNDASRIHNADHGTLNKEEGNGRSVLFDLDVNTLTLSVSVTDSSVSPPANAAWTSTACKYTP